jgi:hypothetical protein
VKASPEQQTSGDVITADSRENGSTESWISSTQTDNWKFIGDNFKILLLARFEWNRICNKVQGRLDDMRIQKMRIQKMRIKDAY